MEVYLCLRCTRRYTGIRYGNMGSSSFHWEVYSYAIRKYEYVLVPQGDIRICSMEVCVCLRFTGRYTYT